MKEELSFGTAATTSSQESFTVYVHSICTVQYMYSICTVYVQYMLPMRKLLGSAASNRDEYKEQYKILGMNF